MGTNIIAPLDLFEKTLLQLFQSVFTIPAQEIAKDEDIQRVFSNWIWTRKLGINFRHAFIEAGLPHEAIRGNIAATWEGYLSLLDHFTLEFLYFRTDDLRLKNPHLPEALLSADLEATKVVISPEDIFYWTVLAQMFYDNFVGIPNAGQLSSQQILERLRENWPVSRHNMQKTSGMQGSEDIDTNDANPAPISYSREKSVGKFPFSIYGLVHKCSILQRRGGRENDKKVMECLFSDQKLATLYEPLDQDGSLIFRPFKDQDDNLRTLARLSGSFYALWLTKYGDSGYGIIEDPREFIEFIPWGELTPTDVPGNSSSDFVLWNAQKRMKHDHHLFTEEEVFRYCILHDFTFQGHIRDGSVCFQTTKLKDRAFVELVYWFWEMWNDCAITQNPSTQEYFLLETIPGRTYRELWDQVDRSHAIKYFRRLVDHHRYGEPVHLQNALGIHYRPEYENLLELIPFPQIEIASSNVLRGAKGAIYKAIWTCPAKIGMADGQEKKVALKTIPASYEKALEDFIRELDTTFAAASGNFVNVVELYGITKSAPDTEPPLPANSFFLVLEFAEMGSALELLESRLLGNNLDWTWILSFMMNIGNALLSLHDRKIIHRDLHWGNVLATVRANPNAPQMPRTVEFLLADLGEGKVYTGSAVPTRSHGKVEFQAPEVRKFNRYSEASDMFDLGWLTSEIIAMHWARKYPSGTCHHDYQEIPTVILELLRELLNPLENERLTARKLVEILDREILRTFEAGGIRHDVDCDYAIDPNFLNFEPYSGDLFAELNDFRDEDEEMP